MEQQYLPTTIEFLPTDQPHVGKVVITPCQQGYGTTLGNSLRRVLLSSLPGAAVESVKIAGAQHEFSTVEGIKEDVIEVILNMKQLAVLCHSDVPVTLTLSKKGIGDVTAADFDKNSDVEIINTDLKIATITDAKKPFEMEIIVKKGKGYVPVSEKETKSLDLGTIAIDSLYTPIRDIGYHVELTRVGDVTDYEKLTLTIETNGTMTPKEALSQATKILMDHFSLILEATVNATEPEVMIKEPVSEETEIAATEEAAGEGPKEEKPAKKKSKKSAE